jgi:hypothetical protein
MPEDVTVCDVLMELPVVFLLHLRSQIVISKILVPHRFLFKMNLQLHLTVFGFVKDRRELEKLNSKEHGLRSG